MHSEGYGAKLQQALYLLNNMDVGGKKTGTQEAILEWALVSLSFARS